MRQVSQRVLITGGCGFIGSSLAIALAGRGGAVTCFDNLSRRGSELTLRRVQAAGCAYVHGDLRNPEDLARLPGSFDLLLECSAEPSVQVGARGADADFLVRNNLVATAVALEFARTRRLPLLFLSTSRVYPYSRLEAMAYREEPARFRPVAPAPGVSDAGIAPDYPLEGRRSLYGATKLASELLIQEYAAAYDLPALINRCGVVAGPWQMGKVDQGFATHWVARHHFGGPLAYIGYGGLGKQVRDVLHVDDLTDLVLRQIDGIGEFRGEVFHASGGADGSISLCELTALCREITGRNIAVTAVPENRPADLRWCVLDARATMATFRWAPARSPRMVLLDIHRWLRDHEAELAPLFRA